MMRVSHVLRKYEPSEWGGTETALLHLTASLKRQDVESVVFCPHINNGHATDRLAEAGCAVKRFRATVPVWGITAQHRRNLIANGGNLMSFDLPRALTRENDTSLIHAHTLGRLGAIARNAARRRNVPFIITIHGGLLDLPAQYKAQQNNSSGHGLEWGKAFGLFLGARNLPEGADAVLTCNSTEAALLKKRYPTLRVEVQPHGIDTSLYHQNHRGAFSLPEGRQVLLCLGRIDPVKNQHWLVEQLPAITARHPRALLVFVGATTNRDYEQKVRANAGANVLFTGGLPPGDPRLISLLQQANVVILPSISETFGLVILEAWAAGAPVIASRTSGAKALIQQSADGQLFDLEDSASFHTALDKVLGHPRRAEASAELVRHEYNTDAVATKLRNLYEHLIEEKNALRHNS